MKRYVIDGSFLTKRVTGMQRFAREVVRVLDRDRTACERLSILVPVSAVITDPPENIPVIRYGKLRGRLWQQLDLPRYLKKTGATGVYPENTMSVFYPHGIMVLHDIALRARPDLFRGSVRGILYILWRRLLYRRIAHSDMPILTVSEFSGNEIMKYYGVAPDRIRVLCNGWQHMDRVVADETLLPRRFPALCEKPYLFTLGSASRHKNTAFILRAAQTNPGLTFVIGGTAPAASSAPVPGNVLFTGYLQDTEIRTLMAHCTAFLFPSLYEGFGIPPLEAAAAGAPRLILSDIPVLREVFGDFAQYIDPAGDGSELSQLLAGSETISAGLPFTAPRTDFGPLLARYSWERAAQGLLDALK